MKHFIGKNRFELQCISTDTARDIQHEMSRYFWQKITTMMEELFDEICEDHRNISIDTLEIDLGVLPVDMLEKGELSDLIRQHLKEQINTQKNRKSMHSPIIQRILHAQDSTDPSDQPSFTRFDRWLYYLDTGYYAWDMPLPDKDHHRHIIEALASDRSAINRLRSLVQKNARAFQRLIASNIQRKLFLKQLAEVYTTHNQNKLLTYFDEWIELIKIKGSMSGVKKEYLFQQTYWIYIFDQVIRKGQKKRDEELLFGFFSDLFSQQENTAELIKVIESNRSGFKNILSVLKDASNLLKQADQELNQGIKDVEKEHFNESTLDQNTKDHDTSDMAYLDASLYQRGTHAVENDPLLPERRDKANNATHNKDELYAAYAGVVLLHPFLPKLFEALRLTENNQFSDRENHEKAILMVHYLASGTATVEDYALVLPKLLCAWPMDMPLTYNYPLTDHDRQEGDALLDAAITHWKAIGQTGRIGLREGYLMRPGKMQKRESEYVLTVEKNTIDILLEKLPWTLSMVKLPWMKNILRVDWR